MGGANGTQFRLVDAEVELRRETRDFARWTLADVEELHRRFKKTFGFAVTASQFESLLLLKAPESVGIEEVFEVLDANRDGRVDGLELLAALACVCRASFEDKARFTFDLFDFNHNGSLSLAELALLMKSVLIGMTLLTGGDPENSSSTAAPSAAAPSSSMEAMLLCLGLAENAFTHVDTATAVLRFEDFIAWARSNREFMLQVERFRLIAEKAVGFEDALSLPGGSDDDSDLDAEDLRSSDKSQDAGCAAQVGNNRKWAELPPPWMIEPTAQQNGGTSACKENGMPPPANLQLDWVYGTSGPSARNACRLLATGEAVYFVGSYVVLYSSERHEQRYYQGHRRPIGCLDVNASGEIVATGDACASSTADNKGGSEIHVWNARTLQCLAVLRNFHPAGVAHVSFPAPASAATATLRQTQALSLGERSGAGGNSSAVLSSSLMKKKPQETEALIASIGSDDGASMALWNWQKEAVAVSGRAHPAAMGRRARTSGSGKRPLALALNEDGDEIVVVGAHFVVFHHVGGRFFKHKKPHWHGAVDPPLHTVPACLSAVYYGIQTAVVGTARGELLLFERHILTRCIQAHDTQTSVNVCLLSCQSMVLFSAGKDGQIKQWDSTLRPIGQSLDLHALLQVPEATASSSQKSLPPARPENILEGDDFRISSLDYDALRRRFLVATRAGSIFEIDDQVPAPSSNQTGARSPNNTFRWTIVASGHNGQPTRSIATASTTGGCFASCGVGERFVKLWSLRRRSFIQHLRFPGAAAAPSALEFSSDGERLAVGSEDGTVMLARRAGAASSSGMIIETTMKNTSSAVIAMRFGPLKAEPLLAVARDNGLVYLYRLDPASRRFSRYMLLKPQAGDDTAKSSREITPAHALDFSVDGAFLRTQHGNSTLYFWDLRQRAGTRVTSMTILRDVQWYTHSTSIGWNVGGLPIDSQGSDGGSCVVGNTTRGLALVLNSDGDIHLTPFPCPPLASTAGDSSQHCWLSRSVPKAHLAQQASLFCSPSCQPPLFGDFALRGSIVITSSQLGQAICQWRVGKELGDVQPRPACRYDQALRKRLQMLGLKDMYFGYELSSDDDGEQDALPPRRVVTRKTGGDASRAVVVRGLSESSSSMQRSEAPDLALTLSYVYGFNHRSMSVNQSLACLGNGSYVYAVGPLLVVRHLNAFGTRQRVVTSRLQHSVSCIVKHPSEPVLAVGSRRDDRVVLLRTEKSPASGGSAGESFHQVATLKASVIPSTLANDKKTLISVDFCDSSDSSSRNVQSDLAAVIWKSAHSHVHTLVFYAWKRQLTLAHTTMTRLPVLFGKFAGSPDTGVQFVSGGVDHVTFWQLNPAAGHVTAQQGVFGRHALVQTMMCAAHVTPFVLTGGEDGSVVLWESGVAAHTVHASSTARHSSGGDGVVELKHLQASQVVLGALRNGSLVVWKYTTPRSPTLGARTTGNRIQANTFLQLTRVVAVIDGAKPTSASSLSPLFNSTPFNYPPPIDEAYVQSMCLLDDSATTSLVRINSEGNASAKDSGSALSNTKNWSSPLPTIVVGLDDGHLMLAWYPLTRGDVTTPAILSEPDGSIDPAVVTKEYTGCFSRGSQIRRIAFSFANAFVVALARNSSGSTQVVVWKTDYDDELRLRQRFALKSAVSLESSPSWYTSPADRALFEECIRAQRTREPVFKSLQQPQEIEEEDDKWTATDSSLVSDEWLNLEFVYGLNLGATGSRNVFYADDAWEIVYAAGACGVVYNTKTQTQLLNYNADSGRHTVISAMAVHPKGDLVASGECLVVAPWPSQAQKMPEIVIWDANSGSTVLRVATKHRPGVLLLDFSPDGHRLASIGMESDHTLAIYAISGGESEGGRLRATLLVTCKTSTRRVWGLSFGEDGELVTCGDQHILFWQQGTTSTGRGGDEDTRPIGLKTGLLTSHKECNPQATLLQIAHIPGRARIGVSSQADGSLYLWKDRVCTVVRRDAHGDAPIPALAVDRKQSLLYSAGADSRICVWNSQLELVRVVADIAQLNDVGLGLLPLTSTKLQSLAVRDGHVLFTTSGSEVCELVEAASSQQKTLSGKGWRLHVYVRGHTNGQLCGLAVHPCKRAQFASAGDDGTVRLWDAATRSLLAFHRWESASRFATGRRGNDELRAVAFSSDGKHLAVGTLDGVVRVLTTALDAVVTQWSCWQERQQGHGVLSLQYSLDGKLLAVGCQDGSVHVYNAASYRKITVLRGATQSADAVRLDFARDRPLLRVLCSSRSTDPELRLWDLGTWRTLPAVQVRDVHWESKRYPSLVNGTTQSEDFNGSAMAVDGHATPVTNWAVTKNEHFLLSSGGADRVVCQFRLPPRTATSTAM
ncbi:hypothetical protein KRP22_000379 [Phytophthora ramorum]|nr:Echinoderm microtubule-associated protein-like 6 [Phytophthora ramorum]